MSWPLSQDFNEAVQNPASAFADPDLKGGTVGTNAMGVPIPRSGNYADVYQITSASGQKWAVKCFTRATSAGLDARYAAVSEHLNNANLPFTVGFNYLQQGIRVRGQWYPIVKMQWVDGFPINAFVRDNLNRSTILENMLSLWVRLCRRLRETGMAHCDIQHGNVLLVPAEGKGNSLGLKLVDYDGMFVPALANQPSGEAGHPSFQHPERVATGAYSPDLDRFPHLVVATALRGLLIGGKTLWDRYDTGDNLLFIEKDFKNPGQSKLFKELWETGDPFTVGLVAHLALACSKPLHQTPWLDQLMPGGQPPILTPSQERQAAAIIGVEGTTPAAPIPAVPVQPPQPTIMPQMPMPPQYAPPQYAPAQYAAPPPTAAARPAPKALSFDSHGDGSLNFGGGRRSRRKAGTGSMLVPAIIAGVVVLGGIVGGILLLTGGKKKNPDLVQKNEENKPEPNPPTPEPEKNPPSTIIKPELDPPKIDPMPVNVPPKVVPTPAKDPPGRQGITVWSVPVGEDRKQKARSVRLSQDGTKVLVALEDRGVISVLGAADGKSLTAFRDHEPPSTAFVFALPQGKAMSVAREPVMIAWDLATGKASARAPLARPRAGLTAVRADRNGQYAVFCWDDDISVIDIENGGRAIVDQKIPKGPFGFPAVAIAPDGKAVLAIATDGRHLREIALPSKQQVDRSFRLENANSITAWTPERKLAALRTQSKSGRIAGGIDIVNTENGEVARSLPGTYELPSAFSLDGRYFVAYQSGQLEQWDTGTWTKTASVALAGPPLSDLDLSSDGQRAVLTGPDNQVRLVSFSAEATPVLPGTNSTVEPGIDRLTEIASLATADVNLDSIRFWAVDRTGKMVYLATDMAVYPVEIASKKNLNRYAPEGRIRQIWTTVGGEVILEVRNGRRMELHVLDGQMCRPTGPGVIRPELPELPKSVQVPANGSMVAVTKDNGHVACIDLKTGRTIYTFHPNPVGTSAFFSADCSKVIVNCLQRLHLYVFANRPRFTWFDPSRSFKIDTIDLEDVSPEGTAVAMRTPGTDNAGTRFVVGQFEGWKPIGAVSSAMTGGGVQFRFLTNNRAILTEGNRASLVDVATGKRIGGVASKFDPDAARSALSPTGEYVLLGTSSGVMLLKTSGGPPPVVVQQPMLNKRLAVPDAAALALVEKAVKEKYAAEFAKKLPADRKKLGERLLADAREMTTDPPDQYFMLREAMAIAIETQDAPVLMKSADALDEVFEVDGFALKVTGLEKIAAGTAQSAVLKSTAELVQELAEELADKDEYDRAIKLAGVASSCFGRSGGTLAQRELDARIAQLKKAKDAFDAIRPSAEKLKSMPEDPEANTVIGKFRCLTQGRWDEGLKHLAIGSDPALRKLAEMELKASTDAELNDVNRGDQWWDYSEKCPEPDKAPTKQRAKHWYSKSLTTVRVGNDRATAEKRLSFTLAGSEFRPGLVAEEFSPRGGAKVRGLLVNTIEFTSEPQDVGNPGTIGMKWTGVIVPPAPGRYKLVAETRDDVRVTMGLKPDEKKIISTVDKGLGNKEAFHLFAERPVTIVVEYGGPRRPQRGLTLKWIRPGGKTEEVIPASAFFHKKDDEKLVTEK